MPPRTSHEGRLQELIALNRALVGTADHEEVLRLVVEKTSAFTGADACVLVLANPDGTSRVAASVGLDSERVLRFKAPLSETILCDLRELFASRSDSTFFGKSVLDRE